MPFVTRSHTRPWSLWTMHLSIGVKHLKIEYLTPTVSLGVTSAVVCTYGCGDGRIALTRCAVIDAGLGDRWSRRRACRRPPAAAGSARSALAAGSRPGSPAAPDGFHR